MEERGSKIRWAKRACSAGWWAKRACSAGWWAKRACSAGWQNLSQVCKEYGAYMALQSRLNSNEVAKSEHPCLQ